MKWIKAHWRKLVFFCIFFLGCGTSSIWMSLMFLDFSKEDFAIGLLTISIASVYSSAERMLNFMRTKRFDGNEDLIELIAMIAPLLFSSLVVGLLKDYTTVAIIISLVCYLCYCCLWWYQNRDNETLNSNRCDALGGII